MNPNNLSLFSRLISATPDYWKSFRKNALKYGGIAGLLLAGVKTGNIHMAEWLIQVLQYFVLICGSSAVQATLTVDTNKPAQPATDDTNTAAN